MKHILLFSLTLIALTAFSGIQAQTYLSNPDTLWGNYCYIEKGGKPYLARQTKMAMTSMPATSDQVLAYYYRIPSGNVKADVVWVSASNKTATVRVKVSYPNSGKVLYEGTFSNSTVTSSPATNISTLFSSINFPADDFYRVELSSDNWSALRSIQCFYYYRESELPVLIPRNFGGTSAYIGSWETTEENAPSGYAYDWAYLEARCDSEQQYPGTYYVAMGLPKGYLGMQTNSATDTGFQRRVVFSMWDAANGDVMKVPDYMQSKVLAGNSEAVHTHAGGEGSSASVMFKDNEKWWQDNHWVQFLLNTRPMTSPVTVTASDGTDSTFDYGYTLISAWYKVDSMDNWRYIATLRTAGINQNIASWYEFIEPFTSMAGQARHRVYYRHGAVRSANGGKWYHRNKINYSTSRDYPYRDFHYDYGRGVTKKHADAFYLDMGDYTDMRDSGNVVPLANNMSWVDTIDIDAKVKEVDAALGIEDYYTLNKRVNQTASTYATGTWTCVTSGTTSASTGANALDGNSTTYWRPTNNNQTFRYTMQASEQQTVSSIDVYWASQYDFRCKYADIYTSTNGSNYTLAYDSLQIRCVDETEILLPKPLTTRYLRIVFYGKYTSSQVLRINELTPRGSYDLGKLKSLAQELISNANSLNGYSSTDLANLASVYNNGSCTDANALSTALYSLSATASTSRNDILSNNIDINSTHAYVLKNAYGYGILGANSNNSLTIHASEADDALTDLKSSADITSTYNNWLIIHEDNYTGYYLYNLGAKKFLNTETEQMLSTTPQILQLTKQDNGFYFYTEEGKEIISLNPASEQCVTIKTSIDSSCIFTIYDNFSLIQESALTDSIQQITAATDNAYEAPMYFIVPQSNIVNNLKVRIQAASSSNIHNYYIKETNSTCLWAQGADIMSTWKLISTGGNATHRGITVPTYYLQNTASGNYIKTPSTGKMTSLSSEAAKIAIFSVGNPPESNKHYDKQNENPDGWTDSSVILFDAANDYWLRNDVGKASSGSFAGGGTHNWMWNLLAAADDFPSTYQKSDEKINGISGVTNGSLVVIEAASTTNNYGYYIKERNNQYYWQKGFDQQSVWKTISTGTANQYYFQNVYSGRYMAGSNTNPVTVESLDDAAPITLYGANSPWTWKTYPDATVNPTGWDANSIAMRNVASSSDWWLANDAGHISDGLFPNSGKTYNFSWNFYNASLGEKYTESKGVVHGSGTISLSGLTDYLNQHSNFTTIDLSEANNLLSDISEASLQTLLKSLNANNAMVTVPVATISGQNIISGSSGICNSLVLTDGYGFLPQATFTAATAKYSRTLKNQWASICLPFAAKSNNVTQLYKVQHVNNSSVSVEEADSLEAGEPGLAFVSSKTYSIGDRVQGKTDISSGNCVVIEAASSTTNYGYYIKQTGTTATWAKDFDQQCVWKLIATGTEANRYYFQNTSTGRYLGGKNTSPVMVNSQDSALTIILYANGDKKTWSSYTNQTTAPQGWDDNCIEMWNTAGGAYANDAFRKGDFGSYGAHNCQWRFYKTTTPSYILSLTGSGTVLTAPTSKDNSLVGTFLQGDKINETDHPNAYYIKDNQFKKVNNYFNLNAFRAYLEDGTLTNSPAFSIIIGGDPVGISVAAAADPSSLEIEAIYSPNGIRLHTLQRGINIVRYRNGKSGKILVK